MLKGALASRSTKSTLRSGSLQDPEFGTIKFRRNRLAKRVSVRINDRGEITATLPARAPMRLISVLLDSSRVKLRKALNDVVAKLPSYVDGMLIGQSHTLRIEYADVEAPKKRFYQQNLIITLPLSQAADPLDRSVVGPMVKTALTREAKAYLPRRLAYLSREFGFSYQKIRFGNQRGRWGSCSSKGTISLNVALMNLDRRIIDYVLIHELAHTKHMNHSADFWHTVEKCMPDYKQYKKELKSISPVC